MSGGLLLLFFQELERSEQVIAIGALIVGLLGTAEGIFLQRIAAWNSRRFLVKGRIDHVFIFSETELTVEIPGLERSVYPYSAFLAAYERNGYFTLLIDKRHAFIIDKSGFSSGDPEQFRSFLQERLGKEIPVL